MILHTDQSAARQDLVTQLMPLRWLDFGSCHHANTNPAPCRHLSLVQSNTILVRLAFAQLSDNH